MLYFVQIFVSHYFVAWVYFGTLFIQNKDEINVIVAVMFSSSHH